MPTNFAFLKTSLCGEMNLEEGDVLRFLNLSFSMQNKSFPSALSRKKNRYFDPDAIRSF